MQPADSVKATHIQLTDTDLVPLDSKLTFSIKTITPATFSPDEKIEVATADGSFHTTLSMADGGITLQDAKTALVSFDPAKSFGSSAFGPLRFRPISGNGTTGDWQQLATLVRLPVLDALQCSGGPSQMCTLKGGNLFLLQAVAADSQFAQGMQVPDGFAGNALQVPHPVNGTLYIKLRDDPDAVSTAVLPRPAPQRVALVPAAASTAPPAPVPAPPQTAPSEPSTTQAPAPAPAQPQPQPGTQTTPH